MVEIMSCDILSYARHVEAGVNPVNYVGIFNAVLALLFKREYPDLIDPSDGPRPIFFFGT